MSSAFGTAGSVMSIGLSTNMINGCSLLATSSPGLFPQKMGGAGKRPWHRLVTCAHQIFISTVMYEFLWSILHPHWLTAFQKNILVY